MYYGSGGPITNFARGHLSTHAHEAASRARREPTSLGDHISNIRSLPTRTDPKTSRTARNPPRRNGRQPVSIPGVMNGSRKNAQNRRRPGGWPATVLDGIACPKDPAAPRPGPARSIHTLSSDVVPRRRTGHLTLTCRRPFPRRRTAKTMFSTLPLGSLKPDQALCWNSYRLPVTTARWPDLTSETLKFTRTDHIYKPLTGIVPCICLP